MADEAPATEFVFELGRYGVYEPSSETSIFRPTVTEDHPAIKEGATEFTLFLKLPPELRAKIWKYHCNNNPRLVKLQFGQHQSGQWSSPTKIPSILHVNSESRCEGLKVYELSFATRWRARNGKLEIPAIVYFNPQIDTIYFDADTVCYANFPFFPEGDFTMNGFIKDTTAIKRLALETMIFSWPSVSDKETKYIDQSIYLTVMMRGFLDKFKKKLLNLEYIDLVQEMDCQEGATPPLGGISVQDLRRLIRNQTERQKIVKRIGTSWLWRYRAEDGGPMPSVRSVLIYKNHLSNLQS